MPKRNVILIALVCLLAGGAIAFLLLRPTVDKIDVNRNQPPEPPATVPQVLTKVFPSEANPRYTVEVEYPELQGISKPGIQDKINGQIKTGVYNQIAGFQAANASNLPLGDPDLKSSLDGSFDALLVTKSFFSALMSYSDYSAGAAHPNNYLMALNFDLKTGDAVKLDQLLRSLNPSAGYAERLGKYVKDDIVRQFGSSEDSIDFEGYLNFTLDTKKLSIHFDPGQVAATAAGSPQVDILYSDLISKIIKPAGQPSATSSVEWWLQ